jgi:hypothetical protein
MYLYVIIILAQSSCGIRTSSPPTGVALESGQGWWLTSQCEWEKRPCPLTALLTGEVVQRLPMGCRALQPTIAYTRMADLKIRKDFAEAKSRITGLTTELTASRLILTQLSKDSVELVQRSKVALTTCIDTAQLQSKALKQAESQLFWSRLTVATSVVAIVALSVYGFTVAN